ncbi:uncharacterized protein PpBr36_10241 [Pyricularia pennisetigena]|uniref:uncharacterized protein n=1 Tax=Pyricularia pennisetigena TaxID=1578925 RepID=UPI0011511357|nr:uncharacterized protein PpBr36_10241 [Pyricularia pennisetigena]TLS21391.1 hypothetical protein PpBr36_10241 [Pyricularia pennisetigena]
MHLSMISQLWAFLALSTTVLSAPVPAIPASTTAGNAGGPRAVAACPARRLHARAETPGPNLGGYDTLSGRSQTKKGTGFAKKALDNAFQPDCMRDQKNRPRRGLLDMGKQGIAGTAAEEGKFANPRRVFRFRSGEH